MDLKSFLHEYPELKLLKSAEDNQKVLKLMEQSPMRLGFIDLLYDRTPDFQALLQAQGPNYLSLLSTAETKEVTGCFSISTAVKYIDGKKKTCAYIGDFRTNGSRKVAMLWRKEYQRILNIFKNEAWLNKPEFFLTAVLKKNQEAVRNLTGGKKDFGFYYHLLCEKNMVNIFGRWPFPSSSDYDVQMISSQDFTSLKHFLDSSERQKQFGNVFDGSEDDVLLFRQKNWPDMRLENFLLIKDVDGKIVASCLPWNPRKAKRMSVSRIDIAGEFLIKFLRKFRFHLPLKNQSLETVYMTHLCIDKSHNPAEIISSFLNKLLKLYPAAHMISFADDFGVFSELDDYIKQTTSVLLYQVSADKHPTVDNKHPISFEMGLV